MPLRLLCLSVLCLCSVVASAETSWIWGAKNNVAKQEVWFRTSFELKEVPAKALLQAAADNHCVVWLNGKALERRGRRRPQGRREHDRRARP